MKENGSSSYTVKKSNGDFKTYYDDGSTSHTIKTLDGDLKTYNSDGSTSRTTETLNGDLKTYNSDGSTSRTTKTLNGDLKTYNSDGSTSYTRKNKGGFSTYYSGGSVSGNADYSDSGGVVACLFAGIILGFSCVLSFTSIGEKQYIILAMIIVLIVALRFLRNVINPNVLGVWAQLCGAECWMKLVCNNWEGLGSEASVFGLIGAVFVIPVILSCLLQFSLGLDVEPYPALIYYLLGFNKWISGVDERAFLFSYAIVLIYAIWYIYGIAVIIKYAKRKEFFVKKKQKT